MTPEDKIQLYFNVSSQNPEADLDSLVSVLIARGIDTEDAECMIAFVPMAFAHCLLSPSVKLPDSFTIRNNETGVSVRGLLKNEVFFTTAVNLAQRMSSEGEDSKRSVFQIASMSAELSVVDQMVRSGSEIANIVLVEPVLLRVPTEHLAKKNQSRWKFWNR